MRRSLLILGLSLSIAVGGVLPATNPPWNPTYNLSMSTLTMQCNGSGFSSPQRGSAFGIVSYDWSNAKADWAMQSPMDCEERLLSQARMTKSRNADTNVFVYRNLVKALPWFTTVREKILDPAYAGWFINFSGNHDYHVPDCAAENKSKCSVFYHDQEQTPAVPTAANPHPDGSCPSTGCDVGHNLPCGEYVFDHRNESLREFLIDELFLGKTGMGDPSITGFFVDDFWCSDLICKESDNTVAGCPCSDPVQGPTEMDANFQNDTGLSDEDIRDITLAWNETMGKVQKAILKNKGYTWSLIEGQGNANASPMMISASNSSQCSATMRQACSGDYQKTPHLFGIRVNGTNITNADLDVAFFLAARGEYAWIGWGVWGMTWPFNPEPAHGELPPEPSGVPLPEQFELDVGVPVDDTCSELSPGVFSREWSNAHVYVNCVNLRGVVELK